MLVFECSEGLELVKLSCLILQKEAAPAATGIEPGHAKSQEWIMTSLRSDAS